MQKKGYDMMNIRAGLKTVRREVNRGGMVLLLSAGFLSQGCSAAKPKTAEPARFKIGPRSAELTRSDLGGAPLPLQQGGGFVVHDFNAKQDISLKGKVVQDGDRQVFDAKGKDVTVHAVFSSRPDGSVEVTGELTSLKPTDRAMILRYTVPLQAVGASFEKTLSQSQIMEAGSKEIGTYIPVAAMTGKNWGIALSIPPEFPCCFGMTGTEQGLGVEFYLGLTPVTKSFPNKAAFRFVIDAAQPGWGFRSALDRYYKRHAQFYTPRYKGSGFWNWNDPAVGMDESLVKEAWPLFKAHGMPLSNIYDAQAAQDSKYGVTTFAYMIVGMRELTKLPGAVDSYENAMKIFETFEKDWAAEGENGELRKKYTRSPSLRRNLNLPAQIRSSTMADEAGNYRMNRRTSVWGGASVTFIENPNPDLFKGQGKDTVGSISLAACEKWMQQTNVGGIHMDSLGIQWPSWMNYRADHFPDARYPLTFDKNGRIGLHNMVSHYEFLEDLWSISSKYNKLLFGNGIDIYTKPEGEHYNSIMNGRWFLFARMDMAGREITDDRMDRERMEAVRSFLGHKLGTVVLYIWHDTQTIKEQMNRALAYNIFAAPNRHYADQISYLSATNGFARDKELLKWFSKNARMLHDAGWQPVTYAKVNNQPDVVCERYGTGDVFYFTVGNLSDEEKQCVLAVDMAALGIAKLGGNDSVFSEVSRNGRISPVIDSTTGKVRMTIPPNETWIIKLARTW
jgi:hypothetical protein